MLNNGVDILKITVLDAATLGNDLDISVLDEVGEVKVYDMTSFDLVEERISDAEVVVLNKVKLNETNLKNAKNLKLICVAATGFDNIDIKYCSENNIAVCNVQGYSTDSVAQLTLSMAFALKTNLIQFDKFVKSKEYTKSGLMNRLEPVYHEMSNMVWGIIGYGNIGKKVASVASAMGCEVIVYSRTEKEGVRNVDIDTLCKTSDIISIHTPLNDGTSNIINKKRISMMKKDAVFINTARGAVADEEALVNAVKSGSIGGIGIDVYSKEPFDENHSYNSILNMDNVILTPHMAWGSYESRVRCINEIAKNIKAFYNNEKRNRVIEVNPKV